MIDMVLDYLSTLGVWGLLVGVFIEALGVPFPGGLMILLAGVLCLHGKLNAWHALAAALSGYVLGSLVAFLVARHYGNTIFRRFSAFLSISKETISKTQRWLDRSAGAFVVLGRFIPGIGNLTPYIAGLSNIGLYKFLLYNFLFICIWGGVFLTVGTVLDGNLTKVMDFLRTKFQLIALVAILLYFTYIMLKKDDLKL